MKYKAIIFDMDGTIIHTEHIWRKATHQVIANHGIELTEKMHKELELVMAGVGLTRGCQILIDLFKLEMILPKKKILLPLRSLLMKLNSWKAF